MLQGTGSSVGKSLLVAGLARAFTRRGLRVRPFKPQNMSNNAAVTADGGEIGRAQALQAQAARIPASVHMNPVLLKPQSETSAQIVVQGRVFGQARAREYQAIKPRLMPFVLDSFARLRAQADLVLVEGAGSASEVNLRCNDLANMGFARATGTPVVLVGDIDRGGVIASLVGTRAVLDPADAAMIRGFVVNRMRGDPSLFADGMAFIAERTGWTALGLVPFLAAARRLPAEDAQDLAALPVRASAPVRIAVPRLPCIANFDDLDPLAAEPSVALRLLEPGTALPGDTDLLILPGSKATIADLAALRAEGWDVDILAHVRRGGAVLGICGGYQMLGTRIADPNGVEGPPGTVPGLGLLAIETVLTPEKRLSEVRGATHSQPLPSGEGRRGAPLRSREEVRTGSAANPFHGYEMHMGRTDGPDCARPFLRFDDGRPDGACSPDGGVCGTYVHGLFADDRQRAAWLARFGAVASTRSHEAEVETVLDALAAHLERHMNLDRLLALSA